MYNKFIKWKINIRDMVMVIIIISTVYTMRLNDRKSKSVKMSKQ